MKIIILSFLFTSQAQFLDDPLTTLVFNDDTSTINSFYSNSNEIESSINLTTYEIERSSLDYFDSSTILNEILFKKDEWFNVNQSKQENSSSIYWIKINDDPTYILKSDGKCINKMCRVKLKYNNLLSNVKGGCLSFILSTDGQPVGQLWIEEDEEQESFSQKIQLTNSTLRVEHSLKSKIKNLSIDAQILFRNSKTDRITLSNLNVNWKGPCPKYDSKVKSTLEYDLITLTSEDIYETTTALITDQTFQISQDDYFLESTTIQLDEKLNIKDRSSFVNQSNIGWILSLIILFCLTIILSSFIYGLWTIQAHYRFIWYIPFDYPVQFIARRSIRSSTRSQNKIGTLAQISNELFHIDSQQDYFDSFTTNSERSTPSAFYTYF